MTTSSTVRLPPSRFALRRLRKPDATWRLTEHFFRALFDFGFLRPRQ